MVLFAFLAVFAQFCCVFTFILGGWSFGTALLYVGPYTAFGRAAAGETLGTAAALRLARRRFIVTFLAFAPQSIGFVAFYVASLFLIYGAFHRGVPDDLGVLVWLAPATVAYVVAAIAAVWIAIRWLYLVPLVAVAEAPITIRETFRRSGELAKGRIAFLAVARFAPDAVMLATLPQLNGMRQFDSSTPFAHIVQVAGPLAGMLVSTYVGALTAASAYLVVTGKVLQSPED